MIVKKFEAHPCLSMPVLDMINDVQGHLVFCILTILSYLFQIFCQPRAKDGWIGDVYNILLTFLLSSTRAYLDILGAAKKRIKLSAGHRSTPGLVNLTEKLPWTTSLNTTTTQPAVVMPYRTASAWRAMVLRPRRQFWCGCWVDRLAGWWGGLENRQISGHL